MTQLQLLHNNYSDELLSDLFQAYFEARKNKRNTINALAFEKHFETRLFSLYEDLMQRQYNPRPSICFIINKPVKREIFAASFRDRVIHHYIYNKISPIFEKIFINDSYSCRKGKGTQYGIHRIDHFIRSCSQNYSKECYILKLDICGYFMAMNRTLLYDKVKKELEKYQVQLKSPLSFMLYLLEKVIFNDPTKNCIRKGNLDDWQGLPANKSLFHAKYNCGLPIGNLTSQLFGNVYLNEFDHYVKKEFGIKFYGRYVDDFILIHADPAYLKSLIKPIQQYLQEKCFLKLHTGKIYFQDFRKGVKYLGAVIKPHRIYIANRTKTNFYEAVHNQNLKIKNQEITSEDIEHFLCCMNSYLGFLKHYKTFQIRRKMIDGCFEEKWFNYVRPVHKFKYFVKK